jgi:thioredoxin 1
MADFQSLIQSDKPVLVDFFAEWCGPCKTLAPILKDVKARMGDKITIVKVDVDRNQAAAQAFQIRGVPTMIIFKNGQQLWKQSGVVPAEELMRVINQLS